MRKYNNKIREAELAFSFNGKNFVFEQASPYVDKFDQVTRKLMEAGVLNHLNPQKAFKKDNPLEDKDFWKNKNDKLLIIQMVTILGFGYAGAVTMFFIELTYYCLKQFKFLQ